MFKPTQSNCGTELCTRYVGAGANDRMVENLKATLEGIRLTRSRTSENEERLLLTAELQDELLNITLPFAEDGLLWNDVWGQTWSHIEDDSVLVYGGNLTVETSENTPVSDAFLQERTFEEPCGFVQGFSSYFQDSLLSLLSCFTRGLNNHRVGSE